MLVDAEGLVLGRMAAKVAKLALLGESVDVINCEKAIVSGTKQAVLAKYKRNRELGVPLKGPYFHRRPDMLVRRTIRGMLPYKKAKGYDAFERVKCYEGVPEKFKDIKPEDLKEVHYSRLSNLKYVEVKTICKLLGAKID
ncbi:50S ribosomal protein L13 [Candidatus Woesearchaeota archaeon]|nr:50S ribosomal protein L13 [Candidatus Woesearchaeota archaeon]